MGLPQLAVLLLMGVKSSSSRRHETLLKVDFKDLPKVPDPVQQGAATLAANAAHLANLLRQHPYPGIPQQR